MKTILETVKFKRTMTRDSVSPIAIIARARKTTYGIIARGLHVTVVFVTGAFIQICKMTKLQIRQASERK